MTPLASETRTARIESIDILRGFTLLGIILVHMVEQYYAGAWPESLGNATGKTTADNITQGFAGIFIMGKFFMIFSFLFGLSFYIQFSKSDSGKSFLLRFLWRLAILFAIGFAHHLHYRGDILTIYALLGVGLLIVYRLPDKYLLWFAVLLILNLPSLLTRGVQLFLPSDSGNPFANLDQHELMTYYTTLKSGSYGDILNANDHEFATKMQFQVFSGRLYITFGLFLLGIYAGRKNFFGNIAEKLAWIKTMRFRAWMTIIASVVFSVVFFGGAALLRIEIPQGGQWLIGGFVFDVFNAALACIYVAWILLWLQKAKWQKLLYYLYPVGRMGLTVYLMQTFFGTLIFFSYGLGLLGDIGAFLSLAMAIPLFVVQIFFAKWWFRYFAYGPVEWLWRNLTYLKIHPLMIRRKVVAGNA